MYKRQEGDIFVLDGNGTVKNSWTVQEPISVVQVGDYNNDGKKEILVGTPFGDVLTYTPDGKQLDSFSMSGDVGCIFVFDINEDNKSELVISTKNQAGEIKLYNTNSS